MRTKRVSVVWSMWFVVGGLPVVSELSSCCLGCWGEVSEGVALFAGGSTARHPDLGLKGCTAPGNFQVHAVLVRAVRPAGVRVADRGHAVLVAHDGARRTVDVVVPGGVRSLEARHQVHAVPEVLVRIRAAEPVHCAGVREVDEGHLEAIPSTVLLSRRTERLIKNLIKKNMDVATPAAVDSPSPRPYRRGF